MDKFASLQSFIPDVSRETFEYLLSYEAEIIKWNKHINLVASNEDIWQRHILDSAQLNSYLAPYSEIIDIGSGGGFPAIVLAILNKSNAEFHINLIEKLQKKCSFLQNIIAKLKLPASVHNVRIEDYIHKTNKNKELAITSRAFSSLENILVLSKHLKPNCLFLPKGKTYQLEVKEAQSKWQFSLEIYNSKLQNNSVILKLTNIHY